MSKKDELIHFLDVEISNSKRGTLEYGHCFDGIEVDYATKKKLLESHIRFCDRIKSILLG